ncbi:MAG: hypothetical protein JWQ53_971 [Klenkia sp.]|nr:hypothetical protein [Klenkia sp.]
MRITHRAIAERSSQNMQTNLAAMAKLQDQISSGRAIGRPSDSPSGTSTAMRSRAELTTNERYSANISSATTTLNAADSALGAMGDLVRRARDLVTQGANAGANNAVNNAALATEIAGIRESMLAVANRTVGGVPVFGGTTAGAAAYRADGAYAGQSLGQQQVRVSASETVQTSLDGPSVFGEGAGDVFALLGTIVAELQAGSATIGSRLADLDTAAQRMTTVRAEIGVRTQRLEQVASINAGQALSIKAQLSGAEDIDQAKTYLELTVRDTAYKAALQTAASTIQLSLVDYLR